MAENADRRSVLVTGASRGIGAAIARRFAAHGDRVAVHFGASAAKAELVRQSLAGDGHTTVQADLRDPEAIERMVGEAARALGGRIDVLVNNAGVFTPHPIETTDYAAFRRAWQDTLDVNLTGAANVTFQALRHMPDGGAIVNVSSRGAFRGEPNQPAYGASKAGLVALGQSLARALGPRNISVTTVAPGFVDTDMAADALAGDEGARRRAESPLGRITVAEEVAAAVLFLASDEAKAATGSVLDVNAGSYLRL